MCWSHRAGHHACVFEELSGCQTGGLRRPGEIGKAGKLYLTNRKLHRSDSWSKSRI